MGGVGFVILRFFVISDQILPIGDMIKCIDIKPSEINPAYDVVAFQEILSSGSRKAARTVKKGFLKEKHSFRVDDLYPAYDVISVEYDAPLYEGHEPYINGKFYCNDVAYADNSVLAAAVPKGYFPIVKIPSEIQKVLDFSNADSLRPIEPAAPVKPEYGMLWLLFLIVGVIMLTIWQQGGVVMIVVSLVWALIGWLSYDSKLKEYQSALVVYANNKNAYSQALSKYYKIKEIFQVAPLGASQAKKICIEGALGKITSLSTEDSVKRGVAEKYFQICLEKWFPNEIHINLLTDGDEEYRPDFVFKCSSTNLHIDIEVDEPYTLDKQDPIHFLESGGNSSDSLRDEHFDSHNWVVIRFSEKQVVKTPNECCKIIADTIFNITGNKAYLNRINAEGIGLPIYEAQWDYYDAGELAKGNYREKYLVEAEIIDKFS